VGAFHSATSAIESVLKNVSPNTHWIVRRLVTAGGKRIKKQLLGTVDTVITSWYYVYNKTTASLRNPDHTTTCHTHYTLGLSHPFPCSPQHLSSHHVGVTNVGLYTC
jgi:hypothetical protein